MKRRRWFARALALLCALALSAACAEGTVALDDIGLRYTPAEDERCLTRTAMPTEVLATLGADAASLAAAMEGDGLYLVSLLPDGRQFTLAVSPKPAGIAADNAWHMTAEEKALFLTAMARAGDFGAASWQENGYALFSASAQAEAGARLSYAGLSLATLYLGRVYAFHMDIIGRAPAQADIDLLTAAAGRTLLLGAHTRAEAEDPAATPQPLMLPDLQVKAGTATVTSVLNDLPLTLDPVPDTVGITQVTLSGTTVPYGYLRYAVGDTTSSRIKADETGAFRFTVQGLTGNAANLIELTAFKGDVKTVVRIGVTVDWQQVPFTLETAAHTDAKTLTLRGLTLPNASVKLLSGRGTGSIVVAEDGTFAVTLTLGRIGQNAFTLQAQAAGYHRTDYSFSVTRTQSADEALAALHKAARKTDYAKLTAKPALYARRVVSLTGVASQLRFADGQASFVLTSDAGARYAVRCDDLLAVTDGANVSLLGTLTGETSSAEGLPTLTLEAFVP